ncbi:MAG: zinc-binding dehydrogenase [Oscillospiraceae bacterium]
MKALVKTGKGVGLVEVRDVPRPKLQADSDVIIKITGSGICGTDIHIFRDEFPYWPPVIIGHEFVGVVEEVGKKVTNVKIGDRVVGEPHTLACGTCELCRRGMSQLCKSKRSPGWGIDGADARYLRYPEPGLLLKVPDNVPDEVAVLAEPLAIVTHGVLERAVVEPQDVVAIIGAGPIGILAAIVAKAGGASKTIMLGVDSDEALRFPAARSMGIDETINVLKENAEERIMQLTGGRGADLVIEASGSEGGINSAIDIVKIGGRIGVLGIPGNEKVSIRWAKMDYKVAKVIFSFSSSHTAWDLALRIMASAKVDLSKLVTHRVPLEQWEETFEAINQGKCIKGVFVPDDR